MAVKIRLMRLGKKKQPVYRVVVTDSRKARNGRYIESIGRYEPRQEPSLVEIDSDKALEWLKKGAQPTDRARKVLEIAGTWSQFKIAKGQIHTVGSPAAAAPSPEPVLEEVPEAAAVAEVIEEASEAAAVAEVAEEAPEAAAVAEVAEEAPEAAVVADEEE